MNSDTGGESSLFPTMYSTDTGAGLMPDTMFSTGDYGFGEGGGDHLYADMHSLDMSNGSNLASATPMTFITPESQQQPMQGIGVVDVHMDDGNIDDDSDDEEGDADEEDDDEYDEEDDNSKRNNTVGVSVKLEDLQPARRGGGSHQQKRIQQQQIQQQQIQNQIQQQQRIQQQIAQQQKDGGEDKSKSETKESTGTSGAKPRKKLWLCVYPGCHEPPKTHYNCHSHVWDAHIRHKLPRDNPLSQLVYKKLPDRGAVKALCRGYVMELPDPDSTRKRKLKNLSDSPPQGGIGQVTDSNLLNLSQSLSVSSSVSSPEQKTTSLPTPEQKTPPSCGEEEDLAARVPQRKKRNREESPSQLSPLAYSMSPKQESSGLPQSGSVTSSATSSPGQIVPSPLTYGQVVRVPEDPMTKDGVTTYSLDPNDVVRVVSMSPELARLHVCGEVFSERGFLQRSDARFKEDIAPIRGALARVLRITGKTFRYKGDDAVKMGFIAQELETVVPTAVHRDEHGLSVDVVSLVPLILEALKDLYSTTQEYESDTAKQLNEALHDAMIHVADLDRKFEQFRHPDPSDTDEEGNKKRRRAGFAFDDESDDYYDETSDDYDSSSWIAQGSNRRRKNKEEEKKRREEEAKKKAHFRYQPVFGPPLIVMIFSVFFIVAGFVTWVFLPPLPFVWAFCWGVGSVLLLSLLYQWKEIRDIFTKKEVVLEWSLSNSINGFVLAVVALVGVTITLILGQAAIYLVAFMLSIFLILWVIAVVIHHKYHVRVQSLFMVFVGVLVMSALFFAMLFMARPYECGFEGYTGPRITVPVRVGQEINPISMTPIPWNCFFASIDVSKPLPSNISIETNYTPPYVHGQVTELFNTEPSTVTLTCSGYQQFTCGTLVFLACSDYTTEFDCKSNFCSWCAGAEDSSTNSTGGVCGYCSDGFEQACYSTTGKHSSCYGTNATGPTSALSSASTTVPLSLPLILAALICFVIRCV